MTERKKIRWVSKASVMKAASAGDLAALKNSLKHWAQLADAPLDELLAANKKDRTGSGTEYCALCQRHMCGACPLTLAGHCCCEDESAHDKAATLYSDVTDFGPCSPTRFAKWQKAAGEMRDVIADVLKDYAEEEHK
ncbi:MAG: hypothetical protein HQ559_01725 [Lentisphaerae bacterium]|nr:hypothetical protein [Lentisphaerota bacterium]